MVSPQQRVSSSPTCRPSSARRPASPGHRRLQPDRTQKLTCTPHSHSTQSIIICIPYPVPVLRVGAEQEAGEPGDEVALRRVGGGVK